MIYVGDDGQLSSLCHHGRLQTDVKMGCIIRLTEQNPSCNLYDKRSLLSIRRKHSGHDF